MPPKAERITMEDAYAMARKTPELVREFNLLTGSALPTEGVKVSPLATLIDEATGKRETDERAFCRFFVEHVWLRLPREAEVRA